MAKKTITNKEMKDVRQLSLSQADMNAANKTMKDLDKAFALKPLKFLRKFVGPDGCISEKDFSVASGINSKTLNTYIKHKKSLTNFALHRVTLGLGAFWGILLEVYTRYEQEQELKDRIEGKAGYDKGIDHKTPEQRAYDRLCSDFESELLTEGRKVLALIRMNKDLSQFSHLAYLKANKIGNLRKGSNGENDNNQIVKQ